MLNVYVALHLKVVKSIETLYHSIWDITVDGFPSEFYLVPTHLVPTSFVLTPLDYLLSDGAAIRYQHI